ncbi:MAG: 4'-phosphopantetheinyl transferase superfamily protein, partial [Proteobacteria bacterium]|nr:4'-phosphopantetheinyl transferase superfamily protein [Pseudomonadota bacterium]
MPFVVKLAGDEPGFLHTPEVWLMLWEEHRHRLDHFWALLDDDERRRAKDFVFDFHRERFVIGHGWSREILGAYADEEPWALKFSQNEYGRPHLVGTDLSFNRSYGGAWVMLGVGRDCIVGVDVEEVVVRRDLSEMVERYFSPVEVLQFRALTPSQHLDGFYRGWSRKEAYIKARGMGLSLPWHCFDVSLSESSGTRSLMLKSDDRKRRWSLYEVPGANG